jgi:molybdopterin molybdotransferase
MTGAPVPDGADAVVRFEETDERAQATAGAPLTEISVSRAIAAGENVREAGEDVRAGQVVLPVGARLGPAEIGILASLNLPTVPVHRLPRVAILSTGDEVVDLGPDLLPGQIRNSNSYTIAALVRQAGGEPILLGVARDTAGDLRAKLRSVNPPALFITTGGVSVGDYDVVKDVLRSEGSVDIWQVRMKPGKPLAFGTIGGVPLLGLPGNPVAALVSFEQFARPAIRGMLGHADLRLPEVDAILTERLTNPGGRRHFVRAILERTPRGHETRPTGGQGSALLTAAKRANCFIVVPESSDVVEAGSTVRVQILQDAAFS